MRGRRSSCTLGLCTRTIHVRVLVTGLCESVVWTGAMVAIIVTSLVEALTSQIDNLILPLVTYSLILAL